VTAGPGTTGVRPEVPAAPALSEPALSEPALSEPALSEPALSEPALGEPEPSEPPLGEPALGEPALSDQVPVATAAQMRALGMRLAALLRPGDLVVLTGPLGAGKTTLVQGLGEGLGVRGPITSPTFVIARVHPSLRAGPALVHADAYRLGSRVEVDDLDLDADLDSSVTVVEWGEGLAEELAASFLQITISRPRPAAPPDPADPAGPAGPAEPAELPRTVSIVGWGDRWEAAAAAVHLALSGKPEVP
jgi:tRNA threonylcarbamoyladenosine biosynthesis protein TsaE